MSWTWDDLRTAQKEDKEIDCIVGWLSNNTEQPPWSEVALKSAETKTLWNCWPRLSLQEGVLRRKFEEADGKEVSRQIVLPKTFRQEFLNIGHSGMTGGHLGEQKTALAVQSRAYWPTWKSDLRYFLRTC